MGELEIEIGKLVLGAVIFGIVGSLIYWLNKVVPSFMFALWSAIGLLVFGGVSALCLIARFFRKRSG